MVLDKTGTLTYGRPKVVAVVAEPASKLDEALRLVASLEQVSNHPLANAVTAHATTKGYRLSDVGDSVVVTASEPGCGLTGTVDGRTVKVGIGLGRIVAL